MQNNIQQEVLLRERKRHTARRVASTPSVVLTGGGGVPHPRSRQGGTPTWTDTQTENITFPHPSDAGGKYVQNNCN